MRTLKPSEAHPSQKKNSISYIQQHVNRRGTTLQEWRKTLRQHPAVMATARILLSDK
jgi:hypothetical protein